VIDAASTKPFGFMPFYPGPGLGGHCIPVDPQYLSWKANQHEIETRFIDLADRINRDMPEYVVDRVLKTLSGKRVAMAGANILVLGVAYKPNVSDTRESPAYDIIKRMQDLGATVAYHDPHVPAFEVEDTEFTSTPLREDTLASQDCVILVTDHSSIDVERVVEHAPLVFDTRNATKGLQPANIQRL